MAISSSTQGVHHEAIRLLDEEELGIECNAPFKALIGTTLERVASDLREKQSQEQIVRSLLADTPFMQLISQHRWDQVERCVRVQAQALRPPPKKDSAILSIFQRIYHAALPLNPLFVKLREWERAPPKCPKRKTLEQSIKEARSLLHNLPNAYSLPSVLSRLDRIAPLSQSMQQATAASNLCSEEEAQTMQELIQGAPREFPNLRRALPKFLAKITKHRALLCEAGRLQRDLIGLKTTLEGVLHERLTS